MQRHCRTEAVHIREPVSHEDDILAGCNQLAECLGHNTGLDLGALFHALGETAVEIVAVLGTHGGLVAAAALGHFQRLTGHLVRLTDGGRLPSDTDGQGTGYPVADLDLADGIQNIQTVLDDLLHEFVLKDRIVAVLFHLTHHAAVFLHELGDLVVDLREHLGLVAFPGILHQLVIVVHHDAASQRDGS